MSTSTYEGTLYFLPWFCIKVLTEIFLREGSSSVSDTLRLHYEMILEIVFPILKTLLFLYSN